MIHILSLAYAYYVHLPLLGFLTLHLFSFIYSGALQGLVVEGGLSDRISDKQAYYVQHVHLALLPFLLA